MTPWVVILRVWPYWAFGGNACIISFKLFFSTTVIDQTNFLYRNYDKGMVYQNCFFFTPRAEVVFLRWKILDFEKSSSQQLNVDQTNWVYGNDEVGRVYQIYQNYQGGVGWGLTSIILMTSRNINHIDYYRIKGNYTAFHCHYWFFVNMQIWAQLTIPKSKVTDTHMTVKTCVTPVYWFYHFWLVFRYLNQLSIHVTKELFLITFSCWEISKRSLIFFVCRIRLFIYYLKFHYNTCSTTVCTCMQFHHT